MSDSSNIFLYLFDWEWLKIINNRVCEIYVVCRAGLEIESKVTTTSE